MESSLEMGDTLFFSSVDLSSLIPPRVEHLPELRAILGLTTTPERKSTFHPFSTQEKVNSSNRGEKQCYCVAKYWSLCGVFLVDFQEWCTK